MNKSFQGSMPSAWVSNLPSIFAVRRERRKLSYRQAAAEIGCAASLLHKLEHGNTQRMDLDILVKILRWIEEER